MSSPAPTACLRLTLALTLALALTVNLASASASVDYACVHRNSWRLINSASSYSSMFPTATTDVTSAKVDDTITKFQVKTDNIPSYSTEIIAAIHTTLISRPKASTDFKTSSAPTCAVGAKVAFGQTIGYSSTACTMGYWPPGPTCPTKKATTGSFTLTPAKESSSTGCYAGIGAIGRFVNGVSIFNGGDTNTYDKKGVWYSTAMSHEVYDLDICLGHAAMGEYHHHSHSPCLATQLGDDGSGHSPVFGWIFDGFPIYGPYQDFQVLAKSCWKKRNYAVFGSPGWGCEDGTRSCVLKDPTDPSQGVDATVSAGPSLTGTVTTMSSNTINAVSGIYYQDYYYDSDCYAQGEEYLNMNNGHDHDGLGWHYHLTVDEDGTPTFPYNVGLKYYGCLSGSAVSCQSSMAGGMGGGGGGGGGGGPPPGGGSGGGGPPPGGGSGGGAGGGGSTSTATSTCAATTATPVKSSTCRGNGRTVLSFAATQVLNGVTAATLSTDDVAKKLLEGAILKSLSAINPRCVTITSVSVATAAARRSLRHMVADFFTLLTTTNNAAVSYTIEAVLQASGASSVSALTTTVQSTLSSSSTLAVLFTTLSTVSSTATSTFSSLTSVAAASVASGQVSSDYTEAPTPQPVAAPADSGLALGLGLGLGIGLGLLLVAGIWLCRGRIKGYSLCSSPMATEVSVVHESNAAEIEFTGVPRGGTRAKR